MSDISESHAAQNSGVNDACLVLKTLSADEQMRLEAENRQKAWRDEEDRLEGVREDEREIIARNLLKMNMSLDQIASATGLTREQVSSLS
ncbi:MAG: hypothetical protein K6G15_05300 [Desulfovibrio sp.]|nr:hypothetical protein [Desulfovibrio sp.]